MGRSWIHDINNWNAKQMSSFWPLSQTKTKQQAVSASFIKYTTRQTLKNGIFREDIIFTEKHFSSFTIFQVPEFFFMEAARLARTKQTSLENTPWKISTISSKVFTKYREFLLSN